MGYFTLGFQRYWRWWQLHFHYCTNKNNGQVSISESYLPNLHFIHASKFDMHFHFNSISFQYWIWIFIYQQSSKLIFKCFVLNIQKLIIVIDWMTDSSLMPLSKVFQLYHNSQSTQHVFPGFNATYFLLYFLQHSSLRHLCSRCL